MFTPRPLYPFGDRVPGTHCVGGWVGSRAGLEAMEKRKILHSREPNPDPSGLLSDYTALNSRKMVILLNVSLPS
jgi:DMSO/TMAO reductase YedYZ molybdopterin-dependent catalytic subunit